MLKYRFGLNGAEDELAEWSGAPLEQSVAPTRPSGAPQALVVVATPLTALPDIDRTSSGIATGNVFTGVNTLTGAAGKDFGGVAPYEFAAGDYPQTYGVVSFDAKGNYTYARTVAMADVPLAAIETIYYVSSDAAHNPSNVSTLTIILNPEATAVVNTVAKTASGTNYDETIHAKDPTLKILGLGGDDILVSGASGSTLDGGTGQDTLKGSGSADVLIGGAGGDQLNGGGGANDTASYETSIGVVTVSLASGLGTLGDAAGDILTGVENLTGGKGNDQLTGDVNQNIIHGNAGNDTIDGGDGSDTLFGDAGNDIIYGGGAGDVGNKNDYLHGGLGNDQLHGDRGEDQLFGDAGADHLDGGADNDTATYQDSAAGVTINLANLAKNTGDAQGDSYDSIETFIGTAHVDTMVGDATAHTFYGFDGNDKLSAGTGGDKLNGGYGNDVLIGGIGDDVLGGDQGDDKVSGGDGADTLIGSLGNDVLDGGAGADVLQGSYDDDKLFGGEGSDVLYGEENNDVLDGGAGTDNLIGDIGDDVLIGGAGADSFNGGSDFDYVSYETSIGAVVASLLSQTGTLGDAAGDAMINVEGLKGGAGDDQISGDAVFNKLFGGAGNDILFGDNGNDDLHGGLGNDTLQGGVGTDALFGDAGADHFEGGADTDVATYQDSTAAVVINLLDLAKNTGDAKGDSYDSIDIFRGSTFADTITGDANGNLFQGDKGNDKLAGGAGIDTLSGDLGDDTLNGDADGDLLYGGEGNDKVFGGTGADQLNGENGNDTINGGDDADVLLGGDGNDTLIGGAGADSLFGDAGTDTLTGGAGSDTFAFAYLFGGYGKDKITDFNRAEDTLSISNILDGAGNDIQDLIDAGFGASSSGTTLNVTWNGGASAVTVTGWTGGEVNDVQTLGLILGSHLVVTH